MAYRQRMSDLLEQVRNPQIKESGPSDYLKSKMSDTQINNIKKTWAMKTAKDVTPAIRKMIKDLDIPTQLAIKHANINVISKLVEEGDHEISMAQGELKAISAKATELANMLSTKSDDTDELEAWVQSKITKAKDYINSVTDYVEYNPDMANESHGPTVYSNDNGKIEIVDGEFELLGIKIKISELEEVLYCQTKRFEHILRFRFTNATYQDIEITAPDLIDDLRFYYFMVDNGLPVKMTDDSGRFFDEN